MVVVHILRDGTKLEDITGHVVREEDAAAIYELMRRIEMRGANNDKEERA